MAGSRPGPATAPVFGERLHGASIYLSIEHTPVMRLSRSLNNQSWVPGVYGAIYRANLHIARKVQARSLELLRERIVRQSQRTGRLERAVADPHAVYADALRIVVGVADWLDVQASYWRPVEMGAPGLRGRVIYGFWTRASRFDTGKVALEPPLPINSGRPIIMSWDEPRGSKFTYVWTINNPTEAHHFFYDAWNEVGSSGFMERAYREELAHVVGPNGKPFNLPATFKAYHGRPLLGADFHL